eukprot:TRINITY_DN2903_c0_g1_i2.p1 TRINITY_DN2903_c0_g1~~TRINITY_DN2903_c0_g1_i2.p1  ORF type:complete len:1065 (+),score=399.67 TRINITY_DN2903_c0_g1_i2:89-3196(+)
MSRSTDVLIVGAGIGGAYAAAELRQQGLKVTVIEKCSRVGGRLLSDEESDPGTHNKDELGAMRIFPSRQPRVQQLVESVGCTLIPVPLSDSGNLFYRGGRHFKKSEVTCNGRNPAELSKLCVASYRAQTGAADGCAYFCPVLRHMTVREFLLEYGKGLSPPVDADEVDLWCTFSGYDLYGDNVSAANFVDSEGLYGAALSSDQRYVKEGYQAVADRLLRQSGCELFLSTEVEAVQKTAGGLLVTARGKHAASWLARHVIIATAAADGAAVAARAPVSAARREAMASAVQQVPLFKCFVQFGAPWWRELGLTCGKSTTDLDIRQLHYYDSEDLLVYCSGVYADRWNDRFVRDPAAAKREVFRQVTELHDGVYAAPPAPQWDKTIWKYWYGGSHKWKIGVDVTELLPLIADGGMDGSNVHVCGDAFSTKQGWVDGVLETVDIALRSISNTSYVMPPQQVIEAKISHLGGVHVVHPPVDPSAGFECLATFLQTCGEGADWVLVHRPAGGGEVIVSSAERYAAVATAGDTLLLHTEPRQRQTPSSPAAPPAPPASTLHQRLSAGFAKHGLPAHKIPDILATAAAVGLDEDAVIADQCARNHVVYVAADWVPAPPVATAAPSADPSFPAVPPAVAPAPAKVAVAASPQSPSPAIPTEPPQRGELPCKFGCGYAVTWGQKFDFCCHACNATSGRHHGPRCDRREARDPSQPDEIDAPCEDMRGGWGGSDSEDEYEPAKEAQRQAQGMLPARSPAPLWTVLPVVKFPTYTPLTQWAVRVLFQTGNAAHEVRNALRFWGCLVGPGSAWDATRVALRTRGRPALMRARLLPKICDLLEGMWTYLSVLEVSPAAAPQRAAVEGLVTRCGRYVRALGNAVRTGGEPDESVFAGQEIIDFSYWTASQQYLAKSMVQGGGVDPSREQIAGAARLACNCAHELQNSAVANRELTGESQALLNKVDNIAGKCENAARAAMCLSHLDRGAALMRLKKRAGYLFTAADEMQQMVEKAAAGPGGAGVPIHNCLAACTRLRLISLALITRIRAY